MQNEAVIEAYLGTGLKNKDMVGHERRRCLAIAATATPRW